jgi:formate dehydrogenase major subunit
MTRASSGLFILGRIRRRRAELHRRAQSAENLDWMVAADLFETETSIFSGSGVDPVSQDGGFCCRRARSRRRLGNGQRTWAQWRYQAIHPVGESRSDLRIVDELCRAMKKEYAKGGVFPEPILDLTWDYGSGEEPDPHAVAKEINGRFLADADFPDKKKSFKKAAGSCSHS